MGEVYYAENKRLHGIIYTLEDGGRYPLTGVGDVNTYALFAETITQVVAPNGQAGFIVPTGIATDDSTKAFFSRMIESGRLFELLAFENEEFIFPAVHHSFRFCLFVIAGQNQVEAADFVFFARQPSQMHDERRRFQLSRTDFSRINPNTLTCPVFRSRMDAELTRKIYQRVPVLTREGRGKEPEQNPWGISFMRMFDMSNDSHLFTGSADASKLPLYEAKMIHQFDHRWASYQIEGGQETSNDVSLTEKQNPDFCVTPRYWVDKLEADQRLIDKGWKRRWLLGFRDVTSAHVLRTVIASVLPRVAVNHKTPLILPGSNISIQLIAAFLGNLLSLTFDYIARQKIGGISLTYFYFKQFPVLPPNFYTETDLNFIVPRVLELTYTTHDLQPWAQDLGYNGLPFSFDPDRRARLRAELDAWYAKAYGLTRDELRYILDPADVMGDDYPSETFRVLKNNELKEFGEYRTGKLVLREFDRMTLAEESGMSYQSLLVPPPGQQVSASYSPLGILRDSIDAKLAGLLLSLIRESDSVSRQQLDLALLVAGKVDQFGNQLADAEKAIFTDYRNSGMFEAGRTSRVQMLLRYFEDAGTIRVDRLGVITGLPNNAPDGVIIEEAMTAIARELLHAAKEKRQPQTHLEANDDSKPSEKLG